MVNGQMTEMSIYVVEQRNSWQRSRQPTRRWLAPFGGQSDGHCTTIGNSAPGWSAVPVYCAHNETSERHLLLLVLGAAGFAHLEPRGPEQKRHVMEEYISSRVG